MPKLRVQSVWARDRFFYTGMATAAVAAVFAGFARTYYIRPQFHPSPLPLYLHVHGFVFTVWIALFVAQTTLVSVRRTDLHRRLGLAGVVWSVVMIAAAFAAAILYGRRNVAAGQADVARTFFAVPVFSMVVFVILVACAFRWRRRPEIHKRLMLLATISILDAAVARWPIALVTATPWAYYALTDIFIVVAVLYEAASRKRISAAYLGGGLLIVSAQVLRDAIGRTDIWHVFARQLIG
jgi:hypothetical protein